MTDIPPIINRSTTTNAHPSPVTPTATISKAKKPNKWLRFLVSFISVILITTTLLLTLGFFFFYVPGRKIYDQVLSLQENSQELQTAISQKDLKGTQVQIANFKTKIKLLDSSINRLSYLGQLPIAKNYYADSKRIIQISLEGLDTGTVLIQAIEPYQDFLGLKGTATSSAKTTEDRITFLTQSIESLIPHLDTIDQKVTNISKSLAEIDINRYPTEYQGIAIHDKFNQVTEVLAQVQKYLDNGKPLLSKTSWLLGKDKPRSYLIIFQNDGELRPSGGFWTAYATIKMDKGKVVPGIASNIYDLDDKLQSVTPAPRILKSYHINVPYLNLRDSNLSPDFPIDAKIFLEQYFS